MADETNSRYYENGGFPSSVLKITAIVTMLCDHASVVFFPNEYTVLRLIGRIAFPVFAFMIAEGAARTRSVPKYMLRLLIFGFVSEIPFDLALLSGGTTPFDFSGTNVYFTLLLGLFGIYCLQNVQKLRFFAPLGILLALGAAWAVNTDYNLPGVAAIILFYVFADKPKKIKTAGFILAAALPCLALVTLPDILTLMKTQAIGFLPAVSVHGVAQFNILEVPALLSLPLILRYNGEKGRNVNKFFFYAFYPAHILLLYLISLLTG